MRRPRTLSYVEAAFLQRAHSRPAYLIHAGADGVGTFTIQQAKAVGLVVSTTARARCRALAVLLGMGMVRRGLDRDGADEVIACHVQNYLDRDERYDIVVRHAGRRFAVNAFRALRPGSVVVSIAGPPGRHFVCSVEPRGA